MQIHIGTPILHLYLVYPSIHRLTSCLQFGADMYTPFLDVHGEVFDSLESMYLGVGWLADTVPLGLTDRGIAIPDCLKSFALARCEL